MNVFDKTIGFLKRNAETIMLVLVVICVLGSTAFAAKYDVVYPCAGEEMCTTADLYKQGTGDHYVRIVLENYVEQIETGIRIADCDLLDCKVRMTMTPSEDIRITNNHKVEGWFRYSEDLVEYTGAEILVDGVWQPLDLTGANKFDMVAGTTYTFGLNYHKYDPYDSVDLIPRIFKTDIDQWAWWTPTAYYRTGYNISNAGSALTYYQTKINIDLQEAIDNGTSMRWTWYNTTSSYEEEIDFWRSDGNYSETAWNYSTAAGDVWVLVPSIPAGTNTSTIYVYYTQQLPGLDWVDKNNANHTFWFYEDCQNNTLPKWTVVTGTWNITTVDGNSRCYGSGGGAQYMRTNEFYESPKRYAYPSTKDVITEWVERGWAGASYTHFTATSSNGGAYPTTLVGNSWFWYIAASNYSIVKHAPGVTTELARGGPNASATWLHFQFVTLNAGNLTVYRNGTKEATSSDTTYRCSGTTNCYLLLYSAPITLWDNIRVRTYAATEPTYAIGPTETNPIYLIEQDPLDVTSINILNTSFRTQWNVTSPEDPSLVTYWYKVNRTNNDCLRIINGTSYCGYNSSGVTRNVVGDSVNFSINGYGGYPGTYNLDEATMESTAHLNATLEGYSNLLAIELLNVSSTTKYGYLEVMLSPMDVVYSRGIEVYYCNSSYGFNTTIAANGNRTSPSNCIIFGYIPSVNTYNHSHGSNSSHYLLPFPLNTTTKKLQRNVTVTNTSYFIFKPIASSYTGSTGWRYYYLNQSVRANATQLSTDNGASWTASPIVVDAHLHQFNGTETFYYFVEGSTFNTTPMSEPITLASLPPTVPAIVPVVYNWGYETYHKMNLTYLPRVDWINATEYAGNEILYNTRLVFADNGTIWSYDDEGIFYNYDLVYTNYNTTRDYYYIQVESNDTVTGLTAYIDLFLYYDVYVYPLSGTGGATCPAQRKTAINYTFLWETTEADAIANVTNIQITIDPEPGVPYANVVAWSFQNVNNDLYVCRPFLKNESATYGGNHTYVWDVQVTYGATGTAIRLDSMYDLNQGTNLSKNLYLLNLTEGNYYTFHVVNDFSLPIPGAVVTLWHWSVPQDKWIATSNTTTDITGYTTAFLQSFTPYYLDVSATGYLPVNVSYTPGTITVQEIKLFGTGLGDNETFPGPGEGGFQTGFEYIWVDTLAEWTPHNTYLNESTLASWNITIADKLTGVVNTSALPLEYYGMTIVYVPINGTPTTVYNTTVINTTYNGYLSVMVNDTGTYYQTMWFKRENFTEYRPLPITYYIDKNATGVSFARKSIKDLISPFGFYLFSVVCALLAAGFTSRYSFTGAAVMGLLVLGAFTSLWPDAPLHCISGASESAEYCAVHSDLSECQGNGCITALMATFLTALVMGAVYVLKGL